ncbi:4-hydroxy-tetrahydrodipicolinate synthase [Apibacter raozihei]|uniref:4-hydroxy-tetrahydrodipicolinate synthase n=1 Tax=Apibacter raozihei TaxID=2500547 RepID=UPI000FE39D36|nr:4-hydroxy-tetrahydrodipicolinate synthase [Apibacter raozihei]
MKSLQGLGVALITPFNEDGTIDFPSLENLVNYNVDNGVDYLVVLGTTAETATLNSDEKKQVIEVIKKSNNKRLPLVLGIGGNNTVEVMKQIIDSDLEDFAAVLSVSPYYNKPTQEGIYQHFKTIAIQSPVPIIVYNVPGRTGSNMEAATTLRLANEVSNIIAIKEASPNYLQSTDIIKDKPFDFLVISGDDEFALPMTLAGGSGVISVLGQGMPEMVSKMIHFGQNKQVEEAYKIHYDLHSLFRLIFKEGNPAGIKALLSVKGICKPYTRLPLIPASKSLISSIEKELEKISVLS